MTNRTDVEPAPSLVARIIAAGPAARAITQPCAGHDAVPVRVLILEDMPGPRAAHDRLVLPDGRTFTETLHDLASHARQHPCEMTPVFSNAPAKTSASDHAAAAASITIEKDSPK